MGQDGLTRTETRATRTEGSFDSSTDCPTGDPCANLAVDPIASSESEAFFLGEHRKKAPDPEQEMIRQLTEFRAGLDDWGIDGFDLSRELSRANEWLAMLRQDELLPTDWKGKPIPFPEHVHITFEPRRATNLGTYTCGRSLKTGLRFTINLNPVAILVWQRSPAQTASVLLHEALHLAEDLDRECRGKSSRGGSYHSVEFRRRVSLIGIPCTQAGHELGILPNGPFDKWLERCGIPRIHEYRLDDTETPGRLPKRLSWRCGCQDAVAVQVARGSAMHAICQKCMRQFQPDSLSESMLPGKFTQRIVRE